jgi:hypothetical protein
MMCGSGPFVCPKCGTASTSWTALEPKTDRESDFMEGRLGDVSRWGMCDSWLMPFVEEVRRSGLRVHGLLS